MSFIRAFQSFNPALDLADRWPDWTVYECPNLPVGAEKFMPEYKVILISPAACGWDWALAHVTAHLDLGHHLEADGDFTDQQEDDAAAYAALRLDYRLAVPMLTPPKPKHKLRPIEIPQQFKMLPPATRIGGRPMDSVGSDVWNQQPGEEPMVSQ